jgi:hypothetical protein
VRPLLLALVVLATLLGAAGVTTLVIERRLATLTPGGLTVNRLHYNPFSGRLLLEGLRAYDAAGRELLSAERVAAEVNPVRLLVRPLVLRQARVSAPRLTLRAAAGLDLAELAAGLGAAPAAATGLPVRVEDLVLTGGSIVVEGVGPGGAPLVARDLDVRLSRLTTATVERPDVAFAVEAAIYGATVHLTGQPRGAGYVIHVRARGLAVDALVRDFPAPALHGLQQGRGDVDADMLLTDGRLLASGSARVTDLLWTLPAPLGLRLRAATLAAVVDNFDLTSGAGRITRLDLGAPSLSFPATDAAVTLAGLVATLRGHRDLLLRRVAVTDGTLTLEGVGGVRLERVQLAAHAPERRGDGAWIVSARAGLGADAEVALDGVLDRDLYGLDAAARLQRVALAPWRALMGAPAEWDAQVSFDGRVRAAVHEGATALTLAGRAVLADVGVLGGDGFRAERIALGIRRLQWPAADAIVDRVVMTRLGVDRVVPYETPADVGVPLRSLLVAIEDAARVQTEPAAMPGAVLTPPGAVLTPPAAVLVPPPVVLSP